MLVFWAAERSGDVPVGSPPGRGRGTGFAKLPLPHVRRWMGRRSGKKVRLQCGHASIVSLSNVSCAVALKAAHSFPPALALIGIGAAGSGAVFPG